MNQTQAECLQAYLEGSGAPASATKPRQPKIQQLPWPEIASIGWACILALGGGGVLGLHGPNGRQGLSKAAWVSPRDVQGLSNDSFQPSGSVFQQWARYFEIPAVLEVWPGFSVVGNLAQKPLFLGQTWPLRRPSLSVCLARFRSLQWPAAGSETGMWPSCQGHRQPW